MHAYVMFHDREKIQGAWYSRPSTQRNARFLTVDATATYITGKNETSYYPRAQIFRIENHRFCYFIGIDQLRSSLIRLVNSFFPKYIISSKFISSFSNFPSKYHSWKREKREGETKERERERLVPWQIHEYHSIRVERKRSSRNPLISPSKPRSL